MAKTLVLTFIADDRPGLVELLSDTVAAEGGNWLESRMVHLAEKFAGLARVEFPDDRVAAFRSAASRLTEQGFRLTVEDAAAGTSPPDGPLLDLDLVGPDRPGIVREIAHCLAERGASVEEMETDRRAAPMGGVALFYARARVRVPTGLAPDDLRDAIEALAATLMVDIRLRDRA